MISEFEMQENQQAAPQKRVRTQYDLPLTSADDAGNLANHFINLFLDNCRCVTQEEALLCLGVLSDRMDAVNDSLTAQLQPVDHDHEHEHEHMSEVVEHNPKHKEAVREPIKKPLSHKNSRRRGR